MVNINIFLLCHNESVLLPHSVAHYRKYLPNCHITIYDNESTDNSVQLARDLGCHVISWHSGNILNEPQQVEIKNNCWKSISSGWIIMADMDEWLCVTESDLIEEQKQGVSILDVKGCRMVGESNRVDLSDIDLHQVSKYNECWWDCKKLCFLREKVSEMNYGGGAHECKPQGKIKYSTRKYINKHMSQLGLPYVKDKMQKRYARTEYMRTLGHCFNYHNDMTKLEKDYYDSLHSSTTL